jgi:hypothetical protein
MFKFKFSLSEGKRVVWALVVLLFSAFAVSDLQAQVNTAVLSGTAMDSTGAVVGGVKLEAKNVSTGVSYVTTTDGQGRYSIPELQVGTYDVSAQRSSFQKVVQTGIVMTVGAHSVLDFTLKVGRADEVVEVHGQASSVDTSTAAVGQLIAPDQMANLPLNGRNFTDLLTLAPGVATVPMVGGGGGKGATAYGTQINYAVSGSRPIGLQYLLDGTDIRGAQDHGAGVTITATSLGMDAIQEFTVLTDTYGAQFGGSGAAVNTVSKSGANDLHGSAYEFIRNSVLDAMNYFDVPGVKPSFKRNQFGGTLGGPIKKNKAFYFINYEGLRSGQGQTERAVVPTSLPALFEANGMEPNGSGGWVGPYGEMPAVAQAIWGTYPLAQNASQCPNISDITLENGEGLMCSVGSNVQNEDYGLGRVDYIIGPKDSLFGRYNIERAYQSVPYSTNILPAAIPGYPEIDNEQNQYATIEERHVFSPSLLNEARFGFVRLHALTANGGLNGKNALDQVAGRQSMDFTPGGGLTEIGPVPSNPSQDVMNRFSVGDDLTMTLGAHSLHFGATFTRVQTNDLWFDYSGGWWIFANLSSGVGGGLGGAMYGSPLIELDSAGPGYSYTAPSGVNYPLNPTRAWRQNVLEPYIQDDWKINKRLTINLGVRYEWASNPVTANGMTFVLPGETTSGKISILTTTPTESSFVNATHVFYSNPNVKNIDPRVGLAFDPFADHKTSIRAGFAMYHEPVESRTFAFEAPFPTDPWFEVLFPNNFPQMVTSFNQEVSVLGGTASQSIAWFNGELPTVNTAPYMMQYNLTVQRQLWLGTLFNIGYAGSSGVHLFASIDANPPQSLSMLSPSAQAAAIASGEYTTPGGDQPTGAGAPGTLNNPFQGTHVNSNFAGYMAVEPIAHSTYNSLQTSLTRQFSGALAGNVAYTWSRCLTSASAMEGNEQGEYAINNPWNPSLDRGPCSFNSNQIFSLNAIYGLPFHGNRALNGWQISPILAYSKGLPINVQEGTFQYQSNISGLTEGERPELVPGCKPMTRKVTEWYNPACYVLQPYGTIGNTSENSLNNPNYFDWDLAVMKTTKLTEKLSMQLRAEFFDIVNHPNMSFGNQGINFSTTGTLPATSANYSQRSNPAAYALPTASSAGGILCNPSGAINGPTTGVCYTTSTALTTDQLGSLGDQRQIQFAVKFMF